jgi:hypothetical protein
MFARRLRTLSVLLVFLAAPALADPAGPGMKEPARYAYIIGNATYSASPSGNLDDLVSACPEALAFRKSLIQIGVPAQNIYPLVTPGADGTVTDAAVRKAICNQTNQTLSSGLAQFVGMLMANNDENPLGVVYYAGHGVQNTDDYFAFGVDANVDFSAEANYVVQYPDYPLFSGVNNGAPSAVNLTQIVRRMNGPTGKALLVIIDACRDDPQLDKYLTTLPDPKSMAPEQYARLSMGYFSSTKISLDAEFSNIVVLYSTPAKKPALSGQPGGLDRFSTDLNTYLLMADKDEQRRESVSTFADDFREYEKLQQKPLSEDEWQIPDRIGGMPKSPVFCFKGCPQPRSAFPIERIEVIAAGPSAVEFAFRAPLQRLGHPEFTRVGFIGGQPALPPPPPPASSGPTGLPPPPPPPPAAAAKPPAGGLEAAQALILHAQFATSQAAPSVKLDLDVFYCTGDAAQDARQAAARRFAVDVRHRFAPTTPYQGALLDQVRLLSLDPNINKALATVRTQTTVAYDPDQPQAKTWADMLTSLSKATSVLVKKTRPNYLDVYFCGGFDANHLYSTVYTLVGHQPQVAKAQNLIAKLQAQEPQLKWISVVDPVDDHHPNDPSRMPDHTEVRYYLDGQKADADKLAQDLGALLNTKVVAKQLKSTAVTAKDPIMEIWIGRLDSSDWTQ